MKPLKLIVQAFGPFADREEIDFTQLGNNPLFLINGETGAGKSTLLDAICFALYGETTGKDRDAAEMRCDRAAPDTLTEVTFVFELNGKIWQMVRSPQQIRPKARGEGFTDHGHKATFHEVLSEGELTLIVPKKPSEANSAIQEMTGLNVEQFRQVMVLPQGKFRELLEADSRDRENIFGKLFQTGIYKAIEERLKQKASTIRTESVAHDNKVRGILQAANVNEEAEIAEQLDTLTPELKAATEEKQAAEKARIEAIEKKKAGEALSKLFSAYDKTKEELERKNRQHSAIKAIEHQLKQAEEAEKIQPLKLAVIEKEKEKAQVEANKVNGVDQRDKAKKQQHRAKCAYRKAAEAWRSVDSLKAERVTLTAYEEKITRLAESRKTKAAAELQKKNSSNALQELEKQYRETISQRDRYDQQIVTTQQAIEPLTGLQLKLSELANYLKKRKQLDKERKDYPRFSRMLARENESLKALAEQSEKSRQKTKEWEYQWHVGQAALLAKGLKSDEPCPVCGSSEHPMPAQARKNEKLVTHEQVEESRREADNDKSARIAQERKRDDAQRDMQECQNRIKQLEEELGAMAEQSLTEVEQYHNDLTAQVSCLCKKKGTIEGLQKQLQDAKQAAKDMEEKRDAKKSEADKDEQKAIEARSELKLLMESVPQAYLSEAALGQALKALNDQIRVLETNYQKSEKALAESKDAFTKADTTLDQLTAALAEADKKRLKARDAWHDALGKSTFKEDVAFDAAVLDETKQHELSDSIKVFYKELDELTGANKSQRLALMDKPRPDLEALAVNLNTASTLTDVRSKKWQELDKRHSQLLAIRKQLEDAHETAARIKAEYAIYGTLSDVATGQTGNRISLQRFVLSVLLDEVLMDASCRLKSMSKGRYLLVRKESKAKGNKASGLELEIEDTYTGKARSAATLSGGESFMAALSLALGLSSVVQSHAGGIKLDTLFIDEGFGSLDGGHLDLAIQTLIDLQGSGRMIGIISHVSELKEQVKARIDVLASRKGSKVKVIPA